LSKFLIVDDSTDTCRVLARLLRAEGHDAAWVESGREAMAALENQLPQVLLLDWMMPEMDGADVLRAVRANPRFDSVRVVMFSAISDPTRIGDVLRMGAQGFIQKATPWQTIYARLAEVLADASPPGAAV
jgi:two-component system, OmpR family, phosphate regulon response regulator PhoB